MNRLAARVKRSVGDLLQPAGDPRPEGWLALDQHERLVRQVQASRIALGRAIGDLQQRRVDITRRLSLLEAEAVEELRRGREDRARVSLGRYHDLAGVLRACDEQLAIFAAESSRLELAEIQLTTQVEGAMLRMRLAAAQTTVAEAQIRAGEAMTGVEPTWNGLERALTAAEDAASILEARAAAISRLTDEGMLGQVGRSTMPAPGQPADIEAHLSYLRTVANHERNAQ
jgi:phage shock protein A